MNRQESYKRLEEKWIEEIKRSKSIKTKSAFSSRNLRKPREILKATLK
jgi:hypothetical protein